MKSISILTIAIVLNVTKPNPLDRFVFGSFIITQSAKETYIIISAAVHTNSNILHEIVISK